MEKKRKKQRVSIYQTALWNDGRPTQVYELALLGMTEAQICDVIQVKKVTFEYWKKTRPELLRALNRGRASADAKVAAALYKRAVGFHYKDTVVQQYQGKVIKTPVMRYALPDATACRLWLFVRQRELWSEVQKVENTVTLQMQQINFNGITTEELQIMEKLGLKHMMNQLQSQEENRQQIQN